MGSENSGVVVIGGGPSGLACAWRLAREGRRVTVLEAEDRPGGLCATYEKDGFRFDLGGHRFVSADTELSSRVRAWMGDDLLVRERRSAVLHDGRHFHYPLEAGDLVRSLGVAENARAMLGYAVSRAQRPFAPARSRDDSFDAWVRARFGNYLYNTFFGPYSEKLWGISPSAISADWAEERIGLLDLSDAALRMAGLRRTKVRTYARRYEYPRLGMGQLFARVAEDAQRAGARIELGARVTGLVVEGDRIREVIARRAAHGTPGEIGGDTLRFRADAVYATSPLPEIARQLMTVNGALPAQSHVTDAAARLRFRALRFLNLCLRGERVQPYTWLYVADGARKTSRIQEPAHRSEAMCPPGHASLMLEMPCDEGDALWEMPHDELLALGLAELDALGLHVADRIVSSFSVAVAAGYPVYHLAHAEDRARVLAHLGRLKNLVVGGRQGLFRYVFLDRAMQMGEDAARAILRGEMRADCTEREPVRASRPLEANALLA